MEESKKENKKYIDSLLIIGSGTVINIFLGLIITPIITRIVDPADNGMMSLFSLYASIAVMTLSLGLDQGLVRFFYDKDSIDYKKQLLKVCISIPVVLTIIVSAIALVYFYFFPSNFRFEYNILWFLVFYVIASLISRISLLVLKVEYKSKAFTVCNISNRLVYLIVALFLVKYSTINSFISLIIATLTSTIISVLVAIFNSKEMWSFRYEKSDSVDIKELFKYSLPLVVSNGLAILFQGIDKLSVDYFCTYTDVGVYSAALSIVALFEIVQTTFNAVWAPLQVEQYTKNENHKQFIQKTNKYIVVIMFVIGFSLIMFKGILALFLGEKYRGAAYILPFLVFYPIMYTISETTKGGIIFKKRTSLIMLIIAISCIVNICGNVFLIPRIGYKGAAISTGLSYIVYFFLNTIMSNKLYYIDFQLWKITILIVLLVAFAFYNTFFYSLIIRILIYCVSLLIIYLLYKPSIIELFDYGKVYIKEKLRKK